MLAFADWTWEKYVIFVLPIALVALIALALLLFRETFRTRFRFERQLREDPDISEWLIIFNWSRKVLYLPTVLASLAAAAVMFLIERDMVPKTPTAGIVGGVWLAVFFVSFLVDEYEVSLKILAIVVLFAMMLGLWLYLLGWLVPFLRLFRYLAVSMSWVGFLLIAVIFWIGIAVAWVKGLFYYVAITPNYLNIQVGPTETGQQISREDYNTRIDTGDFLERLLGFGRIIITFRDHTRLPMMLLVGRIGLKARMLESIRGKLDIDRRQAVQEGQGNRV